MKKILNILGASSILGVSVVNLQGYQKLNINSKQNINFDTNNKNTIINYVDDNHINDEDSRSFFHPSFRDSLHTFNNKLIFIDYGSLKYANLNDYLSHESIIYDKNFKITTSIGSKKWTTYSRFLRSPVPAVQFLNLLNKNNVMTSESYQNHLGYNYRSFAQVKMELINDTNKRVVFADFTSLLENNNLFAPVYNKIRI